MKIKITRKLVIHASQIWQKNEQPDVDLATATRLLGFGYATPADDEAKTLHAQLTGKPAATARATV